MNITYKAEEFADGAKEFADTAKEFATNIFKMVIRIEVTIGKANGRRFKCSVYIFNNFI